MCNDNLPSLCIVIPCYNEENVLPITAPLFRKKINYLINKNIIKTNSHILFVDDGSSDRTWDIIKSLCNEDKVFLGISQSRNRGHQNALLAGLMCTKDLFDIMITIDCDGQDDINTIDDMICEYLNGADIVYGVRSDRKSDSFFKRFSAETFYKFIKFMGADIVYNHADYRLVSSRVVNEFSKFKEVNLFLRGLFPLVGFKSSVVYYERCERIAGKSHYPLKKMLALAFEGITSLCTKPLHFIFGLGFIFSFLGFFGLVWSIILYLIKQSVGQLAIIGFEILFFVGIIIMCLGVISEYIGKIYLETKNRPRYIIKEKTFELEDFTDGEKSD